ncbi:DUF456 domain-containing protein [Streptomyces sp. BI20]|uniref:DUF456 domain-containing protein n=1 Tax=Streptomyces sp. BI20 TaxID=3403460 RepID=UPI003C78F8D9
MDLPILVLVGLVLLLGVVGVLIPGVPGTWLVWAALAWWSLRERTAAAWGLLVGATVLLLVVQVVMWLLPARRFRGTPITRRMAAWAGAGALLGFVLLPVVGALPGFVGGVYAHERLRLGRHGDAVASTRVAMRAAGTSVLVELFACLLIAAGWIGVAAARP